MTANCSEETETGASVHTRSIPRSRAVLSANRQTQNTPRWPAESLSCERCSRNVLRFPFLSSNVLPNGIEECVRLAFMEQDGDDGQLAFRVGVDEVGNHVITVPGHVLFAGMMKMELLESVRFIANGDRAGGLSGTAL
jgi:hypothetical protein